MKKILLVARVYLDNIRYLDSKSFHSKMSMAIKEINKKDKKDE